MKYALCMKKTKMEIVEEKPLFPMRINKYMALKGHSTRRGADALIEKGQVTINGKKAVLGDLVNEKDEVVLKNMGPKKDYRYYAFYKPKGLISYSAEGNEEDIISYVNDTKGIRGVFPVGRLDKISHGLIILTDDGRITDRLLSPDKDYEKEYAVTTAHNLRPSFPEHMSNGVELEDCITKPCKVNVTGENTFRIILTEGRKNQIRRMVSAMHNEVSDIKRVRILNIKLGNMKSGETRTIAGNELKELLQTIGLPG